MGSAALAVLLVAIVVAGLAIRMAARARARGSGETAGHAESIRTAAPAPAAPAPTTPTPAALAPPPAQAELPLVAAAPAPRAGTADDDLALIKECVEENWKRAAALGVPGIFQEAYRFIRPWATSFAPGKPSPAILSDAEIVRGDPTTYRFRLKDRPYSIVRSDLGDDQDEPGRLVHERLRLLDDKGTALFEMELFAADYGSDERPGEITAFVEGTWIDDLKELNTLFSRDIPRISDDFRKKFRAKEAERLKRDIGV